MKNIFFALSAFALLCAISGCRDLGKEKTYDGVELYHTDNISDTLANALGTYLVSQKFADGSDKTVQLTKSGDTYHFRMVVKEGMDKDTTFGKSLKFFASIISSQVFNGAPVALELCDDQMTTLKTVASKDLGKTKSFNGVQLFYTSNITEAQADSLGSFLVNSKFANGSAKTVQITKSIITYKFRMVAKAGAEKDPEYAKNAKVYAADMSKDVFGGAPVELDMCDDYLNTVAVFPMADLAVKK